MLVIPGRTLLVRVILSTHVDGTSKVAAQRLMDSARSLYTLVHLSHEVLSHGRSSRRDPGGTKYPDRWVSGIHYEESIVKGAFELNPHPLKPTSLTLGVLP